MKTCFKCKQLKPLTEFYRHAQMGDGFLNKCKECAKTDTKQNREKNIAYYLAYDKSRSSLPHRIAKRIAHNREHPLQRKARGAVSNAIRCGKLKRKPCEVCGEKTVEAHHEDYGRPLDVRWLCFRHHREAHGQKNFAEDYKPCQSSTTTNV